MLTLMVRNWWVWVLRGVLAALFGVTAYIWPEITLGMLVLFFGAYVLVDGIFEVFASITNSELNGRWWLLLDGIFGIGVGVVTFLWPNITGIALIYLIAAWAVVGGIFAIISAIQLRKEIDNEWMLVLSGILSVLFGVVIAVAPGTGALALVWIIAAYAIFFGILLIVFGFRVRSWGGDLGMLAGSAS